ncbi:putative membrane protein [Actinopolyspora mzabensis]|uniref:Putative membrane protein n=1 Tax=Actinopolyspora mzabensis TaxID=995066 RepID=A0A1G9A7K9_ACTMZ|nr:SHOCT domain-containing protein [Actinopolyspora mzabensis]SDK22440.1 putative membrane protein [Actinopolyspora mzabensis]
MGYGDMMGWIWVWPVLLVIALLVFAYLAMLFIGRGPVRWSGGDSSERSSARRILDERFARGDIDEEEYRRRRDELG